MRWRGQRAVQPLGYMNFTKVKLSSGQFFPGPLETSQTSLRKLTRPSSRLVFKLANSHGKSELNIFFLIGYQSPQRVVRLSLSMMMQRSRQRAQSIPGLTGGVNHVHGDCAHLQERTQSSISLPSICGHLTNWKLLTVSKGGGGI